MNKEAWLRHVAQIEVLIESEGMYNTLGAVLEALQTLKKNAQMIAAKSSRIARMQFRACQEIVSCAMTACDLDITYGYTKARKVAMERFKIETETDFCRRY